MHACLDLADHHRLAILRSFFAVLVGIDLVSVYAFAFDREMPGRVLGRYVGRLTGRRVTVAPWAEPDRWWQFAVFWSLSAVPPVLWAAFEFVRAHGAV